MSVPTLHLNANWTGQLASFSSCARSLGTQDWPMKLEHYLQLTIENLPRPGRRSEQSLKKTAEAFKMTRYGFSWQVEGRINWLITNTSLSRTAQPVFFSVIEKSSSVTQVVLSLLQLLWSLSWKQNEKHLHETTVNIKQKELSLRSKSIVYCW